MSSHHLELPTIHTSPPKPRRQKVRFNVGGHKYVTHWQTLRSKPTSRLAALSESDDEYDSDEGEFFFDRNCKVFSSILDYYRTGELHIPIDVCPVEVRRELSWWGMSEDLLSPCCWVKIKEIDDIQKVISLLDKTFGEDGHLRPANTSLWRKRIWDFFEDPKSSCAAKVWAAIYMILVALSIFVVCSESEPAFRVPRVMNVSWGLWNDTDPALATGDVEDKMRYYSSTRLNDTLASIEIVTNAIFTLEFIIRLFTCPSMRHFVRCIQNWIDVMCVISVWIVVWFNYNPPENLAQYIPALNGFLVLRSLRIFRIFKVFRHLKGWNIFILAIKASAWEISILCVFIFTGMLIFATLIFYAEFTSIDQFPNIPIGFWWAIVTMTTVGYGDTHPTTSLGYVVGSVCALSGMLATGLPIPIISNNFNIFRTISRIREEYNSRRKLAIKQGTVPPGSAVDAHVICNSKPTSNGSGTGLASISANRMLSSPSSVARTLVPRI